MKYAYTNTVSGKEVVLFRPDVYESGERECMDAIVKKFCKHTCRSGSSQTNLKPSCGTEDKLFETDELAMAYNEELGYFHIMGKDTNKSYWCVNCNRITWGDDLKWFPFMEGLICRNCIGNDEFEKL